MGLEEEVSQLLVRSHLTLGVVESATGGLIAHRLTNVPGSSTYFKGGIVSYSNELKVKLAGVHPETLAHYGAVSPEVAAEMASGGRNILEVDVCVADTGIAGPSGATPGKPVGLFYLGMSSAEGAIVTRRYNFCGSRCENKQSAADAIFSLLWEYLTHILAS